MLEKEKKREKHNTRKFMSNQFQFQCPKCNCIEYDKGQFQATGGFLSKIFDVQNRKFITVSCRNCGYTEIYKSSSSLASNIFDLFTN